MKRTHDDIAAIKLVREFFSSRSSFLLTRTNALVSWCISGQSSQFPEKGLEERRNQLKSLLSEFQKLQSRLNSLREIQERYEDFSDSVQQLLKYFQQHPAEKEKIGFLGIFADFAFLNTENPKILAPILENILDWVILSSIQDIPKLEKLCQEQNFSRLEILTLDRLPPLNEISSSSSITDKLIQCKPPLQEWGNRWFQQITFVEANESIFEEA